MSNPMNNHVDPKRAEAQQDLMALLRGTGTGEGSGVMVGGEGRDGVQEGAGKDTQSRSVTDPSLNLDLNRMRDVQRLYAPVLELMGER